MESAQLTNFRLLPSGAWQLGLIVARTYGFDGDGRCSPLPRSATPTGEEAVAWKPATDIVVGGHIHARHLPRATAHFELAACSRSIVAYGDRVITAMHGSTPTFSAPAAFERMPLSRARSYGGWDREAGELLGDPSGDLGERYGLSREAATEYSYLRNAAGVGFLVMTEPKRFIGKPIPNLELADDPVLPERVIRKSTADWVTAPLPAAMDWTQLADFPRSLFFGERLDIEGPLASVPEVTRGWLSTEELVRDRGKFPVVPDQQALLGAPLGMSSTRLFGGEEWLARGLLATGREASGRLPSDPPQLRLTPAGCPSFDLQPQLDSVIFDFDLQRIRLVWSAHLEVMGPYPEDELSACTFDLRFSLS